MKDKLYEDFYEEKEEKTDYREVFFKYFIHWKWFVAAFLLSLTGVWLYLRYTTPVYNITATIIVRDDKKGGSNNVSDNLSMLEDLGVMPSSQNIDNEIEIMQSKSLIKDVVSELNLNVSYFSKESVNNVELYHKSPVKISMLSQEADKLPGGILFKLCYYPNGKLDVETILDGVELNRSFDRLPGMLTTEFGTFCFMPDSLVARHLEPFHIEAIVNQPLRIARNYAKALSIEPTSKTTSVAYISLKSSNQERGEDFINKLVEVYNRSNNNDKNEVAKKTEEFIRERLNIINSELGNTEQELETFKRDAGVTDLGKDAELAASEKSQYEKLVADNGIQINLVQYLEAYINNPKHANDVLPTNVGLTDSNLSDLINQYNTKIMERNRMLRSSSETNPVVSKLNSAIRDMHINLNTTINSVLKGLLITKADLSHQTSKYAGRISNAPGQERKLVSIQRQQEIKSGLYLMLLQKREENAIALAATTNNARIIDNAIADDQPVSPKPKMVYLIAIILGIGLPITIIYIKGLLQYRIEGRRDVEKLTSVPILGDIPLAQSIQNGDSIIVHENENDIMAETFRSIRTNVLFMLGDTQGKVILITSTTKGEGKTFIASNLAVSLSLLGKRVLLVGMDIRKPGINKVFNLPLKEKGLTQYLSAPQSTDLCSLIHPSGISDNLYLLPGGLVPPNPTELLARKALEDAIDLLAKDFDYIVLDTAPIGLITDTQIIARLADISIYVCRADYTHKTDYRFINELYDHKRLPLLCTVVNSIDMAKKKYGYYYGYGKYGKYYGYGRRYGYGHRPEDQEDKSMKKKENI